jgi:hypothetical protein
MERLKRRIELLQNEHIILQLLFPLFRSASSSVFEFLFVQLLLLRLSFPYFFFVSVTLMHATMSSIGVVVAVFL